MSRNRPFLRLLFRSTKTKPRPSAAPPLVRAPFTPQEVASDLLVPKNRRVPVTERIECATGRGKPLAHRFKPNPDYIWDEATFVLSNVLERVLHKLARRGGPMSAPELLAQVADSVPSTEELSRLMSRVATGDAEAAADVVRRFGLVDPPDEDIHLAWLRRGAPALRRPEPAMDVEALQRARLADEARAAGHAQELEQIPLQRELRRSVRVMLEQKKREASAGSPAERRAARKWLGHVKATQEGRTRGRPWGWRGTRTEVVVGYWRERFLLQQVVALLRVSEPSRQKAVVRVLYSMRLHRVARELGCQTAELIRYLLGPRAPREPTSRRTDEIAAAVTLHANGKTDRRQLANLLASYGVSIVKKVSTSRKRR